MVSGAAVRAPPGARSRVRGLGLGGSAGARVPPERRSRAPVPAPARLGRPGSGLGLGGLGRLRGFRLRLWFGLRLNRRGDLSLGVRRRFGGGLRLAHALGL